MKWGLEQMITGRSKANVKLWPYHKRDVEGRYVSQRTMVDQFTSVNPLTSAEKVLKEPVTSDGYSKRLKVQVRNPGENTLNSAFWDRDHSAWYAVTFDFSDTPFTSPPGLAADRYFDSRLCFSDPSVVIYRRDFGGSPRVVLWTVQKLRLTEDGTYGDELIVVDGEPDIEDERDVWPKQSFAPGFRCHRILIWHNIAHDGTKYPDAVLRAATGTQPPDGPAWRLRPKGLRVWPTENWNPDSDIRFEPFSYPVAPGIGSGVNTDYRRYYAARWDGLQHVLPVSDADSTGPGAAAFAPVTCTTLERNDADVWSVKLSGRAIWLALERELQLAGKSLAECVPAGRMHALILEAWIYNVTRWEYADAESTGEKDPNWDTFGVFGRVVAVV